MAYGSEGMWEEVSFKEACQLALEVKEKWTKRQQSVQGEGMIEGEELTNGLKIKQTEAYL